jgi:hypothetical protein
MASLHPQHGVRVVLTRELVEGRRARYRVSIYQPSELHESLAHIDESGAVAQPAWAVTFARRVLEGLPKKHAADASWPRKLTRWRDAA